MVFVCLYITSIHEKKINYPHPLFLQLPDHRRSYFRFKKSYRKYRRPLGGRSKGGGNEEEDELLDLYDHTKHRSDRNEYDEKNGL